MTTAPNLNWPTPADLEEANIRRSYSECRYGQLHVTATYPHGGGFDEHPVLLCIHELGASARALIPMLSALGRNRCVYAPDLPGHGQSDAPRDPLSIADYAQAIGDFIDRMRLPTVDVFGHELGCLVAVELAAERPQQVRKVVLAGVPEPTAQQKAAPNQMEQSGQRPATMAHGSQGESPHRQGEIEVQILMERFADAIYARCTNDAAARALSDYPLLERLGRIRQPTLILRQSGQATKHDTNVRHALQHPSVVELPGFGTLLPSIPNSGIVEPLQNFLAEEPSRQRSGAHWPGRQKRSAL